MTVMRTVGKSVSEEKDNWMVTAAISPRDDAFTAENSILAQLVFRVLRISGFKIATKMNDGKKIPSVASRAPVVPPRM